MVICGEADHFVGENERWWTKVRGEFYHTVDAKGRMILPVKLREELGEGSVLFKGLDNCLYVYTRDKWEQFVQKLVAMPVVTGRKLQRFYADNTLVEPDAQGRIMIPQSLRNYANLKKDVTVLGVIDHVEIWDTEAWNDYNSQSNTDDIETLLMNGNV